MPLSPIVNGNATDAAQLNQLINLLTGVMTDQAVTLRMAAGSPLLVDRSDAAGIKGLIAGQRAASTKWFLGLDASDQFAILNAAGTIVNLGITDLGAGTFRGGLAVGGGLSVGGALAIVGALSGVTTGAFSGAISVPASGGIIMGSGASALTLNDQQSSAQTLNFPNIREAETVAVQPQYIYGSFGGLTGTANATGVMMGLAQLITPQVTGRLLILVQTHASTNTNGAGGLVSTRYGTGTAPVNGAALAGTQVGSSALYTEETSTFTRGQSQVGLVTGLTLGTTYWVDLALARVTAGTATIGGGAIVVIEF
jgi:hypothetical protein